MKLYKHNGAEIEVQDALVSGENVKTINRNSILGSGNLNIEGSTTPPSSISGETSSYDNYDEVISLFNREVVKGSPNGKEFSTSGTGVFIDVSEYSKVTLYADDPNTTDDPSKAVRYSLFKKAVEQGISSPISASSMKNYYAEGEVGYHTIPLGACREIYFRDGDDVKYLWVWVANSSGNDRRPALITASYRKVTSQDIVEEARREANNVSLNQAVPFMGDANGWDAGVDLAHKNLMKMARQLTQIEWTPKRDVAVCQTVINSNPSAKLAAGTKYKGIPYTSCFEVNRFVGVDVSLRTFMTAVNNPYSLLYTENLRLGTSEYGFSYAEADRNTIGGWMGLVCSVFAGAISGVTIPYANGHYKWLNHIGTFVKFADQTAQGVRVGDWISAPSHTLIITNVKKDSNGVVTYVEVSESADYTTAVKRYSADQFNSTLASKEWVLYRFADLFKNIEYTPHPEFIAVDNEIAETYSYNNDICTFAGDYAAFREGFPIYINYNLESVGSWTQMDLYKDGVLIETYPIDSTTHRIQLDGLTYGKYEAYLKTSSNRSQPTCFEVIQTDVTYSESSLFERKISFNSANGKPLFLKFESASGSYRANYEFTEQDIKRGYVILNPAKMICEQHGAYPMGQIYLKVFFKGDYGRVSNEPLLTEFN